MTEEEVWKDPVIEEWVGFYEVSNLDRVRRVYSSHRRGDSKNLTITGGNIIKQKPLGKRGLLAVSLSRPTPKGRYHRLVFVCLLRHGVKPEKEKKKKKRKRAVAFIPSPPKTSRDAKVRNVPLSRINELNLT